MMLKTRNRISPLDRETCERPRSNGTIDPFVRHAAAADVQVHETAPAHRESPRNDSPTRQRKAISLDLERCTNLTMRRSRYVSLPTGLNRAHSHHAIRPRPWLHAHAKAVETFMVVEVRLAVVAEGRRPTHYPRSWPWCGT